MYCLQSQEVSDGATVLTAATASSEPSIVTATASSACSADTVLIEQSLPVPSTALSTTATLTADNMPLPNYSQRVMSMLNAGNIMPELDRMIEETAYHILSYGDLTTRDSYEIYGRRLHREFPVIEFQGAEPWVCSYCDTKHTTCNLVESFSSFRLIRIHVDVQLTQLSTAWWAMVAGDRVW